MNGDFYQKKFFIKLYVADVDPKTLSKHKQQVRDKIILGNNVLQDHFYKCNVPLNDIWVSSYVDNHLFSPHMRMLFNVDNFKSTVKREITLLEAIEFLGLKWIPTDEYGEAWQDDRDRFYQKDPYSEKGQNQIYLLQKGIKRLELLLSRGMPIKFGAEIQVDTNIVGPDIKFGADNTFVTITCTEPKIKSYKDAIIDFYDLTRAVEMACKLECGDTYQLSMNLHGLYLQKNNGLKKEIHHFSWQHGGKIMPDAQCALQYIMLRENEYVDIEEVHAKDWLVGLNFGNGLRSVFNKNTLMAKVKQHFFTGNTKTIRFVSTICGIDEPEFEIFE